MFALANPVYDRIFAYPLLNVYQYFRMTLSKVAYLNVAGWHSAP